MPHRRRVVIHVEGKPLRGTVALAHNAWTVVLHPATNSRDREVVFIWSPNMTARATSTLFAERGESPLELLARALEEVKALSKRKAS